ncbi:ceramidase domain-containing protein [Methylobacterium durans]|uniref:Ceramidase n=1 Tax=Methylobacterium durans TaxID=2202825 RepID=A0A2U8WAK6_9HYPH|nr:ceramidase domain-containing protein [Methylobacterium durans]AWN42342.1 hypothetical protein DK389_19895 [Methylobacterium durans]
MAGEWFEPVRAYCERTDPGFWAEPLNAATNAAFLIAAALAGWRAVHGFGSGHAARAPVFDPAALALSLLAACVGVGSFLFHTVALRWSMLADVIPIALFIYAYFLLAMRRFLGLGVAQATTATLCFAGASFALEPTLSLIAERDLGTATNGSIDYVPALLALIGVGGALLASARGTARREAGRRILAVAALFLVSLAFRTADRAACPGLPTGTHFLWHLLNACVLYALILAALHVRAAGPSAK